MHTIKNDKACIIFNSDTPVDNTTNSRHVTNQFNIPNQIRCMNIDEYKSIFFNEYFNQD